MLSAVSLLSIAAFIRPRTYTRFFQSLGPCSARSVTYIIPCHHAVFARCQLYCFTLRGLIDIYIQSISCPCPDRSRFPFCTSPSSFPGTSSYTRQTASRTLPRRSTSTSTRVNLRFRHPPSLLSSLPIDHGARKLAVARGAAFLPGACCPRCFHVPCGRGGAQFRFAGEHGFVMTGSSERSDGRPFVFTRSWAGAGSVVSTPASPGERMPSRSVPPFPRMRASCRGYSTSRSASKRGLGKSCVLGSLPHCLER